MSAMRLRAPFALVTALMAAAAAATAAATTSACSLDDPGGTASGMTGIISFVVELE